MKLDGGKPGPGSIDPPADPTPQGEPDAPVTEGDEDGDDDEDEPKE